MSLSESFASSIYDSIISNGKDSYSRMFLETDLKDITDPYFLEAFNFFQKLNETEQKTLLKILSQTSTDTIAILLSIFDGVSSLNNFPEDFEVTYGPRKEPLVDLSDSFLEYVEDLNDA